MIQVCYNRHSLKQTWRKEKMDDFYTEQLIKKQADSKDTLKKAGLIVLTVLSVLLVFAIPVGDYFSGLNDRG